ncbi:MAG: VapC toxin family PIN domain ribonuclease [Gammaproteobacteria bacterium HGW-Gammaproteobacteria-1]|nr:MAG: VapC toxin family PIN domain ribonuclease [Gammaproteobacteria bacterium HGW-Gammaproteobacteria-1]
MHTHCPRASRARRKPSPLRWPRNARRGIDLSRYLSADLCVRTALVQFECLVAPMRDGNLELQHYYEQGLAQFVQLPMSATVFIHAAQLRARFGLKTPDALHLAAAQHHGCDALWTNDNRLIQASQGLAINVLA